MTQNRAKPMPQEMQMLVNRPDCEKTVIGTIIVNGGIYEHVCATLDDQCFYDGKMLAVWQAMAELRKKGDPIDIITVTAELAREGVNIEPWEVAEISSSSMASTANIDYYISYLKELSLRRRLWRLGQKLIEAGVAETEDVADIQQLATEELNGLFGNAKGVVSLNEALVKLIDIINANLNNKHITGSYTGFRRLDEKGGLHASDLIVIAGESSQGKTALMLSIVKNAAEKGEKISIYSLEMTDVQLTARLLAMRSGVSSSDLMYSNSLNPSQLELIDTAKGMLPGDNIFFDDESTSNLESILLSIRMMKIKHDIKGAVVDYLQILNVNQKNNSYTREQAMGDAARRLKNLAKELGIWVIALSQLNRNSQDPVPTMARLRDSGQIAEAADIVMLVYRPEIYHRTFPQPFEQLTEEEVKGKAMIDVAKGRNIGVFKFLVEFNAQTTHFVDMSLEDNYEPMVPVEEDAPF